MYIFRIEYTNRITPQYSCNNKFTYYFVQPLNLNFQKTTAHKCMNAESSPFIVLVTFTYKCYQQISIYIFALHHEAYPNIIGLCNIWATYFQQLCVFWSSSFLPSLHMIMYSYGLVYNKTFLYNITQAFIYYTGRTSKCFESFFC